MHEKDLKVEDEPSFQPLMKARPAEQVATHRDDSLRGHIQTNVALERRVFTVVFSRSRVFGPGFRFFFLSRRFFATSTCFFRRSSFRKPF